ncbi:hypothetical protein FHS43_006337 [Streptosporangium becharense]|uniref:Transmembrane protein n=1 Tax=Streptosporangium becharense TaxID=1816182 RepID=A0A7W9ICS7_9ACTN|nr:hypothetical protein [Streptosporangium becharense]MBB2915022.1 hypothetical protein [Streptosporangium becharense]MBB5818071.1 hypothetical protein [Streptosporangium becharense]
MRGVASTWARYVRLLRFDGNPLRRRSDRVEALVLWGVLALLVTGVAAAAVLGVNTYRDGVAAERSGRWVTVTLLADAPEMTWTSPGGRAAVVRVRVRWTDERGATVTALAPVLQGSRTGGTARVWLDPSGRPVLGPPARLDTVAKAILAAVGLTAVAAGTGGLLYSLARARLDRRRYARWERAWLAADQRWRRPKEA